MSLVLDSDGVNRVSFEAQQADLQAAQADFDWRMQAAQLALHAAAR